MGGREVGCSRDKTLKERVDREYEERRSKQACNEE
jgi:hypothetical protein